MARLCTHLKLIGYCLERSRHLRVVGDSMEPTLSNRQHLQTQPLAMGAQAGNISRGCIVAFQHPHRPQSIYIKRVVGLPNEHIAIRENRLEIDGRQLEEPYLVEATATSEVGPSQWYTGVDELFLLGDNRNDSEDSRNFGPVSDQLVLGKVWLRYWPPKIF